MHQLLGDSLEKKVPYICGPLTELSPAEQEDAKLFYVRIAEVCRFCLGLRGFVPHEHYDPIKHAGFSPSEVDYAERRQVCQLTNVLIVVAIAPSWGGGIEVEMANSSNVPVVLLHPKNKKISRLLRGNPAIFREPIAYLTTGEALDLLRGRLRYMAIAGSFVPT